LEEATSKAMVNSGATGDFIDQEFVEWAKLLTCKISQPILRTFQSPTDSCRNSGGIWQESRNSAGMTRFRGFQEDSGQNPAGIRVTFLI
jgi:hypothetical protein